MKLGSILGLILLLNACSAYAYHPDPLNWIYGGTNANNQVSSGVCYFDGSKITSGNKLTWDGGGSLFENSSLAASSGNQFPLNLSVTVNQSGTAGYSGIFENAIVNTLGSGNTYLLELQHNSSDAFTVDQNGIASLFNQGRLNLEGNTSGNTGNFTPLFITPTISQSGTAGYAGIFENVTETSTGSGNKYLMELQVGSSDKFTVDHSGVAIGANLTAGSSEAALGTLTWNGTPPTGITANYRYAIAGNTVTFTSLISASVAGSTNTSLSFALPAAVPSPHSWVGQTLNIYEGTGRLAANIPPATITNLGDCYLYNTGSGWTIAVTNISSVAAKYAWCDITYQE